MPHEYGYDLRKAIDKYGFEPVKLWKNSKYQAGHFYWCGYWSKWYQVLDAQYDKNHLNNVTIKWQDGKQATHCTSLSNRDWELSWPNDNVIWEADLPIIPKIEYAPKTIEYEDDDLLFDDEELILR